MRNTSALFVTTVLATIATCAPDPVLAHRLWPAVPAEIGIQPLAQGWVPYRCSDEPVFNFYHGAWYDTPPAIWQGHTYRPYYRYAAWRAVPRTYFCVER